MKEYRLFATIYESMEEMQRHQTRDYALEWPYITKEVRIEADSLKKAVEKFAYMQEVDELMEQSREKTIYFGYIVENRIRMYS